MYMQRVVLDRHVVATNKHVHISVRTQPRTAACNTSVYAAYVRQMSMGQGDAQGTDGHQRDGWLCRAIHQRGISA